MISTALLRRAILHQREAVDADRVIDGDVLRYNRVGLTPRGMARRTGGSRLRRTRSAPAG
jgi:hypothetical protein